jgi:hypothetical protein
MAQVTVVSRTGTCYRSTSGVRTSLIRLAPRLSLVVGGLAAMLTGWGLRFRPSPDGDAWRRGAAGERRTARLLGPLERHGWAILHDLAVPGSQANIDCDDPERGGRGEV